jgi:hypothetical protein
MRPELAHIDEREKQRKEAEAASVVGHEEQTTSKLVAPSLRKADSERVAEIKRSSHAYLMAQVEAEPWVDLQFVPRQVRGWAWWGFY